LSLLAENTVVAAVIHLPFIGTQYTALQLRMKAFLSFSCMRKVRVGREEA
jgi:hypothetical protein